MTAPRLRNSRKQAERLKAEAREKRRLYFMKQREPLIPDRILKRLAALNLPPSEFVYTAVLEKLMKDA